MQWAEDTSLKININNQNILTRSVLKHFLKCLNVKISTIYLLKNDNTEYTIELLGCDAYCFCFAVMWMSLLHF